MIVYALRNSQGEYISMGMTLTKNWLEASKFEKKNIESRTRYMNPDFKLVKFEVKEI